MKMHRTDKTQKEGIAKKINSDFATVGDGEGEKKEGVDAEGREAPVLDER